MTTPQGWQQLYDIELAIMNAGADLYNRGQIDYVYYSPWWDAQNIRLAVIHSLLPPPTEGEQFGRACTPSSPEGGV